MLRAFMVCAVMFAGGMVSACFESSVASSDPQSDAKIAELQAKVAEDRVYAIEQENTTQMAKVMANASDIGQFQSYSQPNPYLAKYIFLKTTEGYVTALPNGQQGNNHVAPLFGGNTSQFFEGSGCTGRTFLVGEAIVAPGIVFRSAAGENLMLRKDAVPVENISYVSRLNVNGECEESFGTLNTAWELEPNDPTVTGINNEPYGGPITVGN